MSQAVLRIERLPEAALAAAGAFYRDWANEVQAALENGCDALVIVLPAAAYDHADWRRAAARDLARAAAPQRINLIAGGDAEAQTETLAYLEGAPGVTGQYLRLHPAAGDRDAS